MEMAPQNGTHSKVEIEWFPVPYIYKAIIVYKFSNEIKTKLSVN